MIDPVAVSRILRKRLSRTRGFPVGSSENDELALEGLVEAILVNSPDAEFAQRLIEYLGNTCHFCPTDADILEAATTLKTPPDPTWHTSPSYRCSTCEGRGWVVKTVHGVEAAAPCSCELGMAIDRGRQSRPVQAETQDSRLISTESKLVQ